MKSFLRPSGFVTYRGFEQRADHGYESAGYDAGVQLTEELVAAIGHGHAASQPAEELDKLNGVHFFASQRRRFDAEALKKIMHFTLKGVASLTTA